MPRCQRAGLGFGLWADDGQLFPNLVTEGLPTTRPEIGGERLGKAHECIALSQQMTVNLVNY
jgi:hypothetical protein